MQYQNLFVEEQKNEKHSYWGFKLLIENKIKTKAAIILLALIIWVLWLKEFLIGSVSSQVIDWTTVSWAVELMDEVCAIVVTQAI